MRMASYTVSEVMDLVTGGDFDSEGESEIEEDPSFPLPRTSSSDEEDSDIDQQGTSALEIGIIYMILFYKFKVGV